MEDQGHINTAFDVDLNEILALLMTMGGLVEQSIHQSATALDKRNAALAEQAIRNDQQIDDLMEEVNTSAVSLIARRQPQAADLRMVVSAIRIAQYLERAGDYAKNIAKRTFAISLMSSNASATGSVKPPGSSSADAHEGLS